MVLSLSYLAWQIKQNRRSKVITEDLPNNMFSYSGTVKYFLNIFYDLCIKHIFIDTALLETKFKLKN